MKTLFTIILVAVLATSGFSAEVPKPGEKAPVFEGIDQDGKAWKLSDRLGKEAIIVYFYPKDETPGCTKQACGFRDRHEELQKLGVTVVGVSRDDAASHKKFREKHDLKFPLLVDTDGKLTDTFGASNADRSRSRRVSFLIGRDGKIVHVVDTRDAQVHLDELKAAAAKLK